MGGARRKLGVVSLALITYFNVSGGPWGSEPIVASCGPLVGILATLIFPFIWCLPLALSFAELFSAFPTDSSFCTWVGKAFGRPMGFYVGYWSWVAGVIDNAIYPCLMVDSVFAVLLGPDGGSVKTFLVPLWMYIVRCIVATAFMLPTIYSIDAVGRFLLVLGIAMIFPFIVLVIVSVFLVALTYSIPFFAASGVDKPHYELWADGFYPIIAEQISGPSLRSWFLVCAILGNLGVYIAKMTKNGFQLAGMADLGLAPSYFIERTASNGVPRRAILLCYLIIMFMAMFDFNVILGVDNFLSSLACVTELCAVVRLRFKAPDLERPYKVSLSDRGLFAMMVVPFCIGSFVMINEFTKSKLSMVLNVITLGCGALYHRQLRHSPSYIYSPMAGKVQLTELGLLSPESVASPTQFLLQADTPKPVYTFLGNPLRI